MKNLIIVIWLIGFLFVFGLTLQQFDKEKKDVSYKVVMFEIVAWPSLLGAYVGENVDEFQKIMKEK